MSTATQMIPSMRLESKDFSGMVTENNFGAMFGEKPHIIPGALAKLEQLDLGEDLYSKLMEYDTYWIDEDKEVLWRLQGADRKNIPLIKATDLNGNSFSATDEIGKTGQKFLLWFPEKYFFQTHVIVGERPDAYKVLLKSEGDQRGTAFVYTAEILGATDSGVYIPFDDLAAGTRWSIEYSISEQTLSTTGSDINFTSPFMMGNRMSMIRKKHVVPGNMIDKKMNSPYMITSKDVKTGGEKMIGWINHLDMEFRRQMRREFASLLMFGQSNRNADGSYGNLGASGYEIKAGMGLREQIAPSNSLSYNKFDIEAFVDYCLSLSVGKLPWDSRKFVIGTGEHGLKMISRAIEKYAGANALAYNRLPTLTPGQQASYNRPQFVKLADINGITLEFMHIPAYDDQIRNKTMHPDGGCAESHRLTIMDFGTSDGQPNIQLIQSRTNQEQFGYINGLRDAYSPGGFGKPKQMSTPLDGYEIHAAKWGGIIVRNPMRMAEWIPAVLN